MYCTWWRGQPVSCSRHRPGAAGHGSAGRREQRAVLLCEATMPRAQPRQLDVLLVERMDRLSGQEVISVAVGARLSARAGHVDEQLGQPVPVSHAELAVARGGI